METGLWEKLQRMAAAGDRVVVVNGAEAYVLLPLAEYERMKSGEASLQRLPGFEAPCATQARPLEASGLGGADAKPVEPEHDELWQISKGEHGKEERFSVNDSDLGQAGDEAEEEERFYLEPVD